MHCAPSSAPQCPGSAVKEMEAEHREGTSLPAGATRSDSHLNPATSWFFLTSGQ